MWASLETVVSFQPTLGDQQERFTNTHEIPHNVHGILHSALEILHNATNSPKP